MGLDLGVGRVQAYPYRNQPHTYIQLFFKFLGRLGTASASVLGLKFKKGSKFSILFTQTRLIDPVVIVFYNVYIPEVPKAPDGFT